MAIDFPSSPANGQIYTDSTSGYSFTYYTTPGAWKSSGLSLPAADQQYAWTNTQTFSNVITFSANLLATTVNAASVNSTTHNSGNATVNSYMNSTTVSSLFHENYNQITANYTIPTSYNSSSTGPITINSGITVTVSSGSAWAIR